MSGARTYIAIAGNIGAGKSTLVDFLCSTYGVQPFFEPGVEKKGDDPNAPRSDDNPYLADFYKDMKAWAFHSQVFFLTHKFRVHQELDKTLRSPEGGLVVQDRSIYEDAEVFATALHRSGKITERDWKTYSELYATICDAIRPPDLMVYLKCSIKTTKQRIRLRGRVMEQAIPTSYLRLLQEQYDAWFERWKKSEVLVIDTDKLDYISDIVHRLDVIDRIERFLPHTRRVRDARSTPPTLVALPSHALSHEHHEAALEPRAATSDAPSA